MRSRNERIYAQSKTIRTINFPTPHPPETQPPQFSRRYHRPRIQAANAWLIGDKTAHYALLSVCLSLSHSLDRLVSIPILRKWVARGDFPDQKKASCGGSCSGGAVCGVHLAERPLGRAALYMYTHTHRTFERV